MKRYLQLLLLLFIASSSYSQCHRGVKLVLTFDAYPSETTWALKNAYGQQVDTGSNYGGSQARQTIEKSLNISGDGNYTFTIEDSSGDGICCTFGTGRYKLVSSDGILIKDGGQFGTKETTSFCIKTGGSTGPTGGDSVPPSVPTNLVAKNIQANGAQLDWSVSTDNTGVSGYYVYANGSKVYTATSNYATLTTLSANTNYTVYVQAFDPSGNISGASQTIQFRTLNGSSEAPTNLRASNITPSSVQLDWSAPINTTVTQYNIYINGVKFKTSTGISKTIDGLRPGTTYSVEVAAVGATGKESAKSNKIQVTTLTNGPSKPTNLVASEVTQNSAKLNWSPPSPANGIKEYKIFVNGVESGTSITTTFELNDLRAETTYYVFVRAYDVNSKESEPSNVAQFKTTEKSSDVQAPTRPESLTASNVKHNGATLTWSASTDNIGVKEYRVYMNNSYLGTTVNTTYQVQNLTEKTTYSFYVSAKDAAGNESNRSEVISVTTTSEPAAVDNDPPTAPTALRADQIKEESAQLIWIPSTDNVGVVGYNVYLNGQKITTTTTAYYTLTGLKDGSQYVVTVKAIDAAGNESRESNKVTFSTSTDRDVEAPSVPSNLKVSDITLNTASLTWNPSTDNVGVTNYSIYISNVKVATTSIPSYGLTGLKAGTVYVVTVKASDAAGNESSSSSAISFKTREPSVTDTTAPSAPQNLSYQNLKYNSVDLTWTASTDDVGVAGYNIYVNNVKVASSVANNLQLQGLKAKTTYSVRVHAIDAAGNQSSGSNVITFTTPENGSADNEAPTVPVNLTVINVTPVSADLNWTASTDNVGVAKYQIYLDNTLVGETNTTSSTLSGLAPSTTYNVHLIAVDAAGNQSGKSAVVTFTTTTMGDSVSPSKPLNLTSSDVTSISVALQWTASTDNVKVVGYNVYADGVKIATASNSPHTLTGLDANKTYDLHITAIDAAGNESEVSNTLQVTTKPSTGPDTAPPSQPLKLVVKNVLESTAGLYWEASYDNVKVARYIIYINGKYAGYTTDNKSLISALDQNTTYSVHIVAVDEAGNTSEQSNVVTFTTLDSGKTDLSAPTAPSGLTVLNIKSTSANLGWLASTDNISVNGYNIYVNGAKFAESPTSSFVLTGLEPSTKYTVFVKAFDAKPNESEPSNVVTFTTEKGDDNDKPTVPSNLQVSNITQVSANVAWSPSTDNEGIKLYQVYLNGDLFVESLVQLTSLTGLTAGTTYEIYVVAVDLSGNISDKSEVKSFTTLSEPDSEAPTAPTNLVSKDVLTTTAKLVWTASTDNKGVKEYQVYLNGSVLSTVNATEFDLTNLTPMTSYVAYVKAVDTANNISGSSNSVTFKTKAVGDVEAPSVPVNLTVDNVTKSTADLKWVASTDNKEVVSYNIYLDGEYHSSSTSTMHSISGLEKTTTYKVAVTALDEAGNESAKSSEVEFTTKEEDPQYCNAYGLGGSNYIQFVKLNSYQRQSSWDGGYNKHLDSTIPVYQGENVIRVRGRSSNVWLPKRKYIRVWIDFNQNYEFEDDELVLEFDHLWFSWDRRFKLPDGAKLGETRMRVALSTSGKPEPCGSTKSEGEVEDYRVYINNVSNTRILPNILDEVVNESPKLESYPNPAVGGKVYVGLNGIQTGTYKVISSEGVIVASGDVNSQELYLDLSQESKGLYILHVYDGLDSYTTKIILP